MTASERRIDNLFDGLAGRDRCRTELEEMRERLGLDAEEAIEDCEKNLKALRDFVEKNR